MVVLTQASVFKNGRWKNMMYKKYNMAFTLAINKNIIIIVITVIITCLKLLSNTIK